MSEYGPSGAPPPGQTPPPLPSEDIRYDLNGNPLPAPARQAAPPQPQQNPYAAPPPAYAQPPQQVYAPPPPAYAPPPPPQSYAPPQQPYGQPGPSPYGAPPGPGYAPGQNPPPAYGPQGGPHYGAPPAAKEPGSKVGWYVAIGFAVCIVLFMVILGNATKPQHVDAPAMYRPADSPDKAFTCSGPDGWTMIGAGAEGSDEGGLLFKKGPVKIDITDSGTLSYLSEGMKAPASPMGDDPNMPAPPPPVEKLHNDVLKNSLKEKYDGYVEQPMQPLQASFGDTRVSEWTAKGGIFTGNIHGYRVTMLGLNKVITVDCHCPEGNWETLKPVFLKVVQSITAGNG